MRHTSLGQMFVDRAEDLGPKVAIYYKMARGPYQTMSWHDFSNLVENISFGLAALGIHQGAGVGIFAGTSHLWVASDLATMCNGAFSVPLYPNSSIADVEYILGDSDIEIVFVSSEKLLERVLQAREKLPKLSKIVYIHLPKTGKSCGELRAAYGLDDKFLISLEEVIDIGAKLKSEQPKLIQDRTRATTPDDIATIIYTSGTTGVPKGVALKHSNILYLIDRLPEIAPLRESELYLSYLPLSHVFERICGEFFQIHSGESCAYAESIEMLSKNLAEVNPTLLLAVPRVLDRICSKVKSGIEGASGRARQLIEWSVGVGKEVLHTKSEGKFVRPTLRLKHWFAETLVLRKLREKIGSRLRLIISGGAPATPATIEFFNAIGIPTLEGYGLTETTAPVCVNRIERVKIGTVGAKLPGVEIKLAKDGEILVKGPSIFSGYYKNEKATVEVFDDGWFKTGDIGQFDKDGYLKITDRKKDLIVNSGGKNIAPQHIECILRSIPCVTQAVVFGDKKKYLVALLTLDDTHTTELAREKGWSSDTFEQLAESKELYKFLKKEIQLRSSKLADYEQVKNFAILKDDLSVDSGELTATLKVKRNVVAKKYADLIESLYGRDAAEDAELAPHSAISQ